MDMARKDFPNYDDAKAFADCHNTYSIEKKTHSDMTVTHIVFYAVEG